MKQALITSVLGINLRITNILTDYSIRYFKVETDTYCNDSNQIDTMGVFLFHNLVVNNSEETFSGIFET
jgi:hypothetical protein